MLSVAKQKRKVTIVHEENPCKEVRHCVACTSSSRLCQRIHTRRQRRARRRGAIVPSGRQKRPTLALRRQDRFHPKGFNMWKLTTAPATEWEGGFSVPGILNMSVREYMASRVSAAGRGHRTRSLWPPCKRPWQGGATSFVATRETAWTRIYLRMSRW